MPPPSKTAKLKKIAAHFLSEHKLGLASLGLIFLLIASVSMLRPLSLAYLLKSQISYTLALLVVLNILLVLFSFIKTWLYTPLEIKACEQLQTSLMQQVLSLPLSFFDGYVLADLVQRLLCIKTLKAFFSMEQLGGLLSFLSLALSFSLLCYLNWQLTSLVLLCVFLLMTAAILSATYLAPHAEQQLNDLSQAYGFLLQSLQGISRIKLFARQQKIAELWQSQYSSLREQMQKNYDKGILGYALFNSIPMLVLLVFFVLSSLLSPALPKPQLVLFLCCLLLLLSHMAPFCLSIGSMMLDALISYKRLKPLINAPREEREEATLTLELIQNIRFSKVHFSYTDASDLLLDGVNCQINQGEHVAFVGLSGSGKSTLLKLLLGFYSPIAGEISINGQALAQIKLSSLRLQIGVVLQDEQLMQATILENMLAYSKAQEQDVWAMLHHLQLTEFINSLPMGINTIVSTALPLLSGGQRQLLLIARALLAKPQVLLLDEATNSLDTPTQALISERINQLKITRITIAHHLSTIRHADRIYVLEKGRISQEGSYEQLAAQDGLFAQLLKSQT